ncbi:MAG: hypothetical protein KDD36_00690 [Flavobacteriales bacterium]|nr:hypothetical protein [Flavobacteriales bacterium]
MKSSDDLFQLIQSMSKSEKRYFKIFASKHVIGEKNAYVVLFDAIASRDTYDEKALVKKLRNEPFIKHLSVRKNYLYNMILEALSAYHAHGSVEAQLNRSLHHAEILYKKSLYKNCDKVLEQVIKTAVKYEYFDYASKALSFKRRMIIERYAVDKGVENKLEDILQQIDLNNQRFMNQQTYGGILMKILVKAKKEGEKIRSMASSKWVFDSLNSEELSNEDGPLSNWARQQYYNSLNLLYLMTSDWEKAYESSRKMLDIFEQNPALIERSPQSYTSLISNSCPAMLAVRKYDEYRKNLHKLKNAPVTSSMEEARRFYRYYNNALILSMNTGAFDEGVKYAPAIKAGLTSYGSGITPLRTMSFYYNLFYVYFGVGDYKNALYWLNKILNEKVWELRQDLMCFSRIVNLILHYELGNDGLLDYAVRSTYLFLQKRERAYQLERIIIDFIQKKAPHITNKTQLIEAFRETRHEIITLREDPYERKALEYFDFIAWIDSKLENKPFGEIVRRDYLERPNIIYHE